MAQQGRDRRSHGKEPQREQKGETMRLVRLLFGFVLLGVFGALALLILAQNWRTTQIDFFGLQYDIHLAWVLVGVAAFGALFTLVLLLPGRFGAMVHTWSLERELRHWEQDLWSLQEQRERLLARHERLLQAHQRLLSRHEHLVEIHERVLQVHHRLVSENSQAIAERDQARAQLAAMRTSLAHQPARQLSMPRVAAVSPDAASAAGAAARIPATSRPHTHGRHGRRGSAAAPRAPRWAAPWPTAPAAGGTARAALQGAAGDDDRVTRKARVTTPLGDQVVVMPPRAPVGVGPMRDAGNVAMRERPPAPASEPVLPAVGEPVLPRTVPVLSTEPAAVAPVAPPLASPLASPLFPPRSLRQAAERAIVSLTPPLARLRRWSRTDIAGMMAAVAAQRDTVEVRLAHLKRSIFSSVPPLGSSMSMPRDLPSDDDQR